MANRLSCIKRFKSIVFLFLIFISFISNSQISRNSVEFGYEAGLSIPLGKYSRNNLDDGDGFAGLGKNLGLSFRAGRKSGLGILIKYTYFDNNQKIEDLKSHFSREFHGASWRETHSKWKNNSVMFGLSFKNTTFDEKSKFYLNLNFGVNYLTSPDFHFEGVNFNNQTLYYYYQESDKQHNFSYSIEIIYRSLILPKTYLNFKAEYFNSKVELTKKESDWVYSYSDRYEQKVRVFNLSIGITYCFDMKSKSK